MKPGDRKQKEIMTTKTLYAASFSGGRAAISLDADGEYEVMVATGDGTDYEYHATEQLALKSCASVGIKMHRIGSHEEAVKAAVADGWKVAS